MSSRTMTWLAFIAAGAAIATVAWQTPLQGAEAPSAIPAPLVDAREASQGTQTAVLAGGCFWGVQGVFEHVRGVRKVIAGYAGGERTTAQYETVSRGDSGHAESVQITYDPSEVSYGKLLQIAFSVVSDPTQLNRQGPDTGTQYRSAVFYADDDQKHIAESYIAQLNPRPRIHASRRHEGRAAAGLLSGGRLSPGLLAAPSRRTLYRLQRLA